MKCQNRYICLSRCLIAHITVFLVIFLAYPLVANAQNWSALNEDQRLILAPLEEDWSSLTAARQKNRSISRVGGFEDIFSSTNIR